MFEARLTQSGLFKGVVEAMKDLVQDANLDCSPSGVSMQAMDQSHVSLVALLLRGEGFDHYRCDRNITLGLNLGSVSKILKCAGSKDDITIKADDDGDGVSFQFESSAQDTIAEFELRQMDIDSEHLGIPDTEYKCVVKMPATEFQRIVRDLQVIGDTCTIACSKDGVKFAVTGDIGSGNVTKKANASADKPDEATVIDMEEPVELTFALRYLSFFTKATPLSSTVTLSMSPDIPLVVEYKIENLGYIRYYLAPKIDED
jgi:proliferating cell nuclear antigen